MKTITYILGFSIIFMMNPDPQNKEKHKKLQLETKQEIDSVEYDLLVFEPGFETFLATLPYSKEFYGNEYYKNWNVLYVSEWNARALNPLKYGDFYETQIDYQPNIDYGIDLNFKLYQYFQFIEKEYGIILVKRK
ncbi:MAG: hypothetical protein KKG99_00310 [Bacteroidetes bacterium]|nr:hypothetical protein [Bacteroidota bacterium]